MVKQPNNFIVNLLLSSHSLPFSNSIDLKDKTMKNAEIADTIYSLPRR